MANETRKVRRAAERENSPRGKDKRAALKQPLVQQGPEAPDPFAPGALRSTYWRVGLIVGALWLIGALVAGVSHSDVVKIVALAIPAVLTVVIVGVLVWSLRQAKRARGVASIMQGVESAEDRKAALERLDSEFKKDDPAKLFAKAQLELQEDPRQALATLEKIDLNKVMGAVADEARGQRAMIHLMLGEVSLARQLADNVDLKRLQDPRSRAMVGAVVAESWARSGQAQKAIETLDVFDLGDEQLQAIKPQLYRSYAFAYAHTTKTKELRRTLRRLAEIDIRLLGGFLMNKSHPLLQKESKRMLEQSGAVPRKMQMQRGLR